MESTRSQRSESGSAYWATCLIVHSVILTLTLKWRHCLSIVFVVCFFLDEELGFEENAEFPPRSHFGRINPKLCVEVEAMPQGSIDSPSVLFLYKVSRCLHMIKDDKTNKDYTV